MAKILLTKNFNYFKACFEDEPLIYSSGKTSDEAVGNLVRSFKDHLNLQIEWSSDKETQGYVSSRIYP